MRKISGSFIETALSVMFAVFFVFTICFFSAEASNAQGEEYYEEYPQEYEVPEYEEPVPGDEYLEGEEIPMDQEYVDQPYNDEQYDEQEQMIDPEMMEEQEPGVYDQSDDVTQTNEYYN